jgi:phosphate transport system permease protein
VSAVDTGHQTGPLQRSSSLAPSQGLAGRAARNTVATVVVVLAFVIAVIPLVWIIVTVLQKGAALLPDASWWLNSQRGITPRVAGGGAYHAIIGTILQALATAVIAVPIGIFAAILLVEYSASRLARVVSFTVDILSGLPSIVAALFVYAFWITTLGFSRSGFAVSLALVLLMIPVIVRSTEEMLKLVPNELREASFALGVPKWKTIVRIVLPTAFSGIVTGVLLGLARIMGETAPLLILVGYSQSINTNLFSGNMAALPLMINNDRQQALAPAVERVWAAALTLVLLVLVLNIAGRLVARFSSVKK